MLYTNEKVFAAQELAFWAHSLQKYGDKPYSQHLEDVDTFVLKNTKGFGMSEADAPLNILVVDLRCAAYLHDLLEDAGFAANYSKLEENFGEFVADICYALQTPKGKNRKQRNSDAYYQGILEVPFAFFIKIADRYCNMQNCIETNSSLLSMYIREHKTLESNLWRKKSYEDSLEKKITQNAWYLLENLVYDIK